MAPHLMQILPHMWNTLTQSADRYVRTVVNYTDDADDPVDSDGELILQLIEKQLLRWKKKQFVQQYIFLLPSLFLFSYFRRSVGIWESCFQCFWVYPWTYRNTKIQENRQEVFRWTYLFLGVVHANHRGAGGFCFPLFLFFQPIISRVYCTHISINR